MKKRKTVIFIIIILIIISIIVGILLLNIKQKIQKGYEVLVYDYCKTHSMYGIAGDAITPWTCEICGYSDTNSNTDAPTLCDVCATITGRCFI